MRLKLLLFALLLSGSIIAQEAYRGLIITEVRLSGTPDNFVEITNVGDQAVNLKDFELGKVAPWDPAINDVFTDPFVGATGSRMMLPDYVLEPGKSYVLATAYDFADEQYRKKIVGFEGGQQRPQKIQVYDIADYLIHMAEVNGDETDSITRLPNGEANSVIEAWNGRECLYLEHHLSDVDSVVIDQVGGVFDNNGQNFDKNYDVAGVVGATNNGILIRKAIIKQGNLDFANARGVGEDDSEWIVWERPDRWGSWRDLQWTLGNHGSFVLDENTLESDIVDVDFANKTITVPWGIRRGDGVMQAMKQKPGVRWNYDLNPNYEDSLTFAARTGDKLSVLVAGDRGHRATFDIVVSEPTEDANIVVPVTGLNYPVKSAVQWWRGQNQEGQMDWPRVTQHESGIDTITGNWYGIPYATRVDSLLAHLEKAPNASWEIVPVDGVAMPDVRHGDKLKVTAQNGDVKEYFIEVRTLEPSHVAYLSAITWPDIPEHYKGLFGWIGDTIPSFNRTSYNYRVTVPMDVEGIPALVAKTEELNATVKVHRATSLYGTVAERTISFEVTAEDDSVVLTYNVELIKEKNPMNVQPYNADPFLSEFVFWDQWSNSFGELANPGNQPIDLSNYMIAMQWNYDPSSMIGSRASESEDDWLNRYDKYVPGYKWVSKERWAASPAILEQDLNVNAWLLPGDVFTFGAIYTDGVTQPNWIPDYVWPVPAQLDIQFNNYSGLWEYKNPWNEPITDNGSPVRKWRNAQWYLFKILNDSIKLGLKPATDPEDFELVEIFGMGESADWNIGGKVLDMTANVMRKPHIYKGNPIPAASFGTNWDDSEWTYTDRPYWQARGIGWPLDILNVGNDIGQHFMYEPTHYKSTVSSTVYKVSEGYSMDESIRGLTTGTTVNQFLAGVTKANDMQVLKVMGAGGEISGDAVIMLNDVLEVMSADSINTTKYVLEVTDEGLSSDAVLRSSRYTVTVDIEPKSAAEGNEGMGTVKGMDYGTSLKTVLANIQVPMGANLTVINGAGAYVPITKLNFDTTYVEVTVNEDVYLHVVAENGITTIVYQLIPSGTASDAFILSDIYNVKQKDMLIEYVPRGTNVQSLLSNLVAASGGTLKVINKWGQERLDGDVADDDKVVVTSADGSVSKAYFISKLSSAATPDTKYLAYILSDIYMVDQTMNKVEGVAGDEPVGDFLTKISAAAGATAMVVDMNGNEKLTGDIDKEDMVKVTSADGKIVVYYAFGTLTSNQTVSDEGIELYPNPTSGDINISGVKDGYRIQIYNSVGSVIRDINVQNSIERISLKDQPAGMYMVVIRDGNSLIGRYKSIKQ